jgi:hypothetical protein
MNSFQILLLSALAFVVVIGVATGRWAARYAVPRGVVWIAAIGGNVSFMVGSAVAQFDRRYYCLSLACLGVMIASTTYAVSRPRRRRGRSIDLSATKRPE